LVDVTRGVPTAVLVAVVSEEQREISDQVAASLRARGIATEVSPNAAKFGKQIQFAERRSIPFVWFPPDKNSLGSGLAVADPDFGHQVKDIRDGEQAPADPDTWAPPRRDVKPQLTLGINAQPVPEADARPAKTPR